MKKTQLLSVTIPAYNEQETLEDVVVETIGVLRSTKIRFEILIVDDGSTDDTSEVAKSLKKKYRVVDVITHDENKGFSGAIKSCYRSAKGNWIFLMPADGQFAPKDILKFWSHRDRYDVVVGYRKNRPESLLRQLNSRMFHGIYRLLFGVSLQEISTVIMWRSEVIGGIDITARDRSALIEPEVIYKAWRQGARFREVGITYHPRRAGHAKGGDPVMILLTMFELVRLRLSLLF